MQDEKKNRHKNDFNPEKTTAFTPAGKVNPSTEKTKLVDIHEISNNKNAKKPVGKGKKHVKIVAEISAKSTWFIVRKVLTYVLNVFLTILLVGVITGAVVGVAFLVYVKNYIDPEYHGLDNLKFDSSLSTSIYYINEEGKEVELEDDRLYGSENRLWAEFDDIPKKLRDAYIAIEDQRFLEHDGIDIKRTASAIYNFFIPTSSNYGGGSTITQQLIKNVSGENDVTIQRKVQEIFRAVNIEERFTKYEILEMYLNTINLSQNTHGVRAAAETYFGKELSELTLVECAALAAIAKSPVLYDPIINPKNNLERRNLVLKLMIEQGKISQEDFSEAYDAPILLNRDSDTVYTEKIHSYYIDAVLEDAMEAIMEEKELDRTTASRMLYSGGLQIVTCLNPDIQSALEEVFTDDSYWPKASGIKGQAAMTVIDTHTGDLIGIVGGRGEKRISRGFNRATQSKRQCGSAIKPLSVYALAIDMGLYTYAGPVDDVPTVYSEDTKRYWPRNAHGYFSGRVCLNYAIQRSLNTVAVSTVQKIGIDRVFEHLTQKMGFTTIKEKFVYNDGKVYSDKGLSPLALGSFTEGVTVREMTQAYNVIASGGIFRKARTFTEIRDNKGNIYINNIRDDKSEQDVVFDEASTYIMTSLLTHVIDGRYGTATRVNFHNSFKGLEVAAKTGSTNDNKDNYFCGYTPDYVACCWYGYDNNKEILTKPNPAMTLWNHVMKIIYTDLEEKDAEYTKKFPVPASIVKGVEYCAVSGKKPTDACNNDKFTDVGGPVFSDGVFTKSTVPTEYCDMHVNVKWDTVTKAICVEGCDCPESNLVDRGLRVVTDRSFKRQVTIGDAQYVYRPVPEGYVYPTGDVPFFQNLIPEGVYVGRSGSGKPYNRLCWEHYHPDFNENQDPNGQNEESDIIIIDFHE